MAHERAERKDAMPIIEELRRDVNDLKNNAAHFATMQKDGPLFTSEEFEELDKILAAGDEQAAQKIIIDKLSERFGA